LWVSFGALSFVDAQNHAPYVGVLPPLRWLILLLTAALALTIAIRPSPRAVSPLWLSAAALLPWLPVPMPLSAFIWTGNLLIWLWTGIAMALCAPLVRWRRLTEMPPRHAALAAGVVAAAAYGLAAWSTAPAHLSGDEPHYLIITQSLLLDHDLKIENNHKRADYASYFPMPLKPDFLKRGQDGEIYSVHAPGLSFLVAPAFALFGYRGAVAELVVIASAASALVWLVAFRVTGDAAASWFGWAAATMTVPFFFHATAIFPDGLGAMLMLTALLPLVEPRAREPRPVAAIGAALAILPWLHSRFAILAACAGLVIAGRLVSEETNRGRRLALFALCPVLSAAGWFLFFQAIYGTPNPSITHDLGSAMALATMVRGAPGLFGDQQFGLIPNAPVYLCALAGMSVMVWRGPRRLAAELLVLAVPYVVLVTAFHQWWGGTTPPARFLVPITLVLVAPCAVWFKTTGQVVRMATGSALLVSLLITTTIASVGRGTMVFNNRDGMSRVAVWLSPVVDLTTALPSLFQNSPQTAVLHMAAWLAAIASAIAVGVLFNRRGREAGVVAFGLALQIAAMAAVSGVWHSNHATVPTPSASGPAVLRRWSASNSRIAFAYSPFHRVDSTALPGGIVLARTLSTVARPERPLAHLPAGVYELRGRTTGTATGRVRVKTDRVSGPIAEWDSSSLESNWMRQVSIPLAVSGLQIEVDPSARKVIRDVSIRAVSLQAAEDTPEAREARRAARYGPSTLFLLGGDAWVEPAGTWIGGRSIAEFAIATDPQAPLQVLVRNGPVENSVTLASAAWREQLQLRAGEERLVQVPSDNRGRPTPLIVAAANGFRPADVNPGSEDWRLLGVWIETR
jgi:hypothetical protein